MTIQKSSERSAAKVFGIVNACLAILTTLGSIAVFCVYAAMIKKYIPSGGWVNHGLFLGTGLGCLFGGGAWCAIAWFTLKTLYYSTNRKTMVVWAIVNLIFILPVPLFVLMIINARTQCGPRQKK